MYVPDNYDLYEFQESEFEAWQKLLEKEEHELDESDFIVKDNFDEA